MLAQPEADDPDIKKYRFIPIIVIMILYALSSLVRKKQEKQRTRPKPSTPKPPSRTIPLPTYARKTADRSSTTGLPQPQRPEQKRTVRTAQSRPAPTQPVAQQTSQRIPTTGPPGQTRTTRAETPRSMPSRPKTHTVPAKKPVLTSQAYLAAETAKRAAQIKARQQMLSTAEAKELRQASQPAPVQVVTTPKSLGFLLQEPSELAHAVVYAEIIGKSLALRSPTTFDL